MRRHDPTHENDERRSPEHPLDAVLDDAGEQLAADAADAPAAAELVRPLRLRVPVAVSHVHVREFREMRRKEKDNWYARVGEAHGVRHVEHEREEDNWDEAARGEGGAESMSISSGQD